MVPENIKLFDIHEYMVANIVGVQYPNMDEYKVHIPLLMPYITPGSKTLTHNFNTKSIYINDDTNIKFKTNVIEQRYINIPVLPSLNNNLWSKEEISDMTKVMVFSINKNINRMFILSEIPEV